MNTEKTPDSGPQQLIVRSSGAAPISPVPYVEPLEPPMVEEDPFARLMDYWDTLVRHRVAILALAFIGLGVGLSYSLWQAPRYKAKASMEIHSAQQALSDQNSGSDDISVQTQIDILKSKTLLKRVRSKMTPPDKPSWQPPSDFLSPARRALGLQPSSGAEAWHQAIWIANGTLDIETTNDSRILKLSCESSDPGVAAEFLNRVAESYMEQRIEERWSAYQNTTKWLNQAQAELKTKVEAAEAELQAFARKAGLLFLSETQNLSEDKLRQLQTQLADARANRIAKEAEYEASKSGSPRSLPEVLDSGPINSYQLQLTDLRRQLVELSSALTPSHYKVKRVEAQIAHIETAMHDERTNIINRIRNEYQAAERTENQIRAEYDRQIRLLSGESEDLIHYRILQREAEINRQLHELTLKQGKEASIASALRTSDARVVDAAMSTESPYKPLLALNLFAGLAGGLVLGSVGTVVRERLRSTTHMTGAMPLQLNMRELGVIPSRKVDMRSNFSLPVLKKSLTLNGLQLGPGDGNPESLELTTWSRKASIMADAFRATVASILFSSDARNGAPQSIVFTSPSPGEGKTTIVCNTAIALAETNRKVLIIDGDCRKPRVHNIFNLSNKWGLSNILNEQLPIESYPLGNLVQKTSIPDLYVITAGSARAMFSSLLYSSRLEALLARLRREFSAVLIDTPPVLRVSDARIMGRAADSVVLVFRASSTTREEAAASTRIFAEDGTMILGTILNDLSPNQAGYGYSRYRSAYSSYYDAGSSVTQASGASEGVL